MNNPKKRFDELKAAAEAAGEPPANPVELRELEQLWINLDAVLPCERDGIPQLSLKKTILQQATPSEDASVQRFKRSTRLFIWSAGIAAVITFGVMLVQIWLIRNAYDDLQTEMRQLHMKVVLASLQSDSATERLKGLLEVASGDIQSEELWEAAVHHLSSDPSTNIRLASVRALQPYSAETSVLDSLRNAALQERSPQVLLEILDLLREADPVAAEQIVQELIDGEHVGTFLKSPSGPATTDL